MKRGARLALALLAAEIVEEGKATDENGQLRWPIVQEAMTAAFFGAPEALIDVLRDRPIIILTLIKTHKRLEEFLNNFEGLWIALIDNLIADIIDRDLRSYGLGRPYANGTTRFGDVYAFFAVTNHRIHETQKALLPPERVTEYKISDFMVRRVGGDSLLTGKTRIGNVYFLNSQYFLVYYDDVTRLFIEILQRISFLDAYFAQPVNASSILFGYLKQLCLEIDTNKIVDNFVCLAEGFLGEGEFQPFHFEVDIMNVYVKDIAEQYASYRHGPLVSKDVEITIEVERRRERVGVYTQRVGIMLYELQRLISRLEGILRRHFEGTAPITQEEASAVFLDKNITRPFRDLLYNKEQGLYNTHEKQKRLFIELIKEHSARNTKEWMIATYGQSIPLACSICKKETHSVDPLCNLAFCAEECRGLFI